MKCSLCDTTVETREWRGHLLKEQIEEYEEYQMRKIMLENGIVTCIKCKAQFATEQGSVDPNYKDKDGNKISLEAAIHLSKYRINCGNCHTVFCSGCDMLDYHVGQTCEQAKEFKQAIKCRYCNQPNNNGQDVCDQDEC